jgi:hypothetical protein
MHFQICLSTLPAVFRESVQDTLLLIGAGLEDCGCAFTIDDTRVVYGGRTINLFLEHFEGDSAESLVQTKKMKGRDFPLGLIFTENLDDTNVMAGPFAWRTENFRRVAEIADFIWYFIPGTERHASIVDPAKSARFEAGYSKRFATVPLQAERDVDFFLPGLTYPRRKPIIERLHALGYHVRTSDLTMPAYIYRSLMGRSKAIIDIRRFDDTTNMSTVRVVNGAANGIAVIAEDFDRSNLAQFYDYTLTTDYDGFVDRCVHLVEREDPVAIGADIQKKFAREQPLKPNVERLLIHPTLDPFRA